VTQGTDTLEETAYFLDLVWDRPEPIVVTGAMRNPSLAGPDGPANLLAAVQVAAHPTARGLGVLVVLNDEINAAALVAKTHASALQTFQSPGHGPIGHVVEGRPLIPLLPRRYPALPLGDRFPPVALVTSALGDDGRVLATLTGLGYKGVVLNATGGGHVAIPSLPAIRDLAARLPVVYTSRTGAGAVLRSTYRFAGGEFDLQEAGVIPAGALNALKARLLLTVLLSGGADRATIEAEFARRGYALPAGR
jgi:L-asparaginase